VDQVRDLEDRARALGLLAPGSLPNGAEGVLSIGVIADTMTTTVFLEPASLLPFVAAGFSVEIVFYPKGEDSG
jgi:hypothetical protein